MVPPKPIRTFPNPPSRGHGAEPLTLSGYRLSEQIYESSRTRAFRGHRTSDEAPIIAKVLRSPKPSRQDLQRLRYEFEIIRSLEGVEGVIQAISLEKAGHGLAMILHDGGGHALVEQLGAKGMEVAAFLSIAVRLTEILTRIHARGLIHKDIKPSNIIINPQTGALEIIDFGIASELPRENQQALPPSILEGTPAYISPEQTGRMNRSIDSRSDLYSLGITFFQMLTGELPFTTRDPMELVHCHIARQPPSPRALHNGVPEVLAQMVLKLTAKRAEERYQSARGLLHDLLECGRRLEAEGSIATFPLGRGDVSDRLHISQKLYGRQREGAALIKAFEQAAKGRSALVLISGYSGVGKSSLVSEVHKPIVERRGYFVAGKHDQYKRNVPYSAILQAFKDLIRQRLTESQEHIAELRTALAAALGANGALLTDVLPELEHIMGPQPPVAALPPSEAINRFEFVIRSFVRVFAKEAHPLTLFLDDLQWADAASLKLIESLLTDNDSRHLLVIGAYRDNEVNASHPLVLTIEALKKQGAQLSELSLTPLALADVTQMVADTLRQSPTEVEPLAALLIAKTQGNPFFVGEFLEELDRAGVFHFDLETLGFRWELARVQAMGVADNVAELMAEKLKHLPEPTQRLLARASCVGGIFELDWVAEAGMSRAQAVERLREALRERLIVAIGDAYRFVVGEVEPAAPAADEARGVAFEFVHDRIQQAAYAGLSEADRPRVHLEIGRTMLAAMKAGGLQQEKECLFEVVNQLNEARGLITQADERLELARLDGIAGKRARDALAYEVALEYATAGLDLLPNDGWRSHYELCMELHMLQLESAYLTGRRDDASRLFGIVLEHAKTPIERAQIYIARAQLHTSSGQYQESIQSAIDGLREFGLQLSPAPSKLTVASQLVRAKILLRKYKDPMELLQLPEITDPSGRAIISLLYSLVPGAFNTNPDLFAVVVLQNLMVSVRYGNCDVSAVAYVFFGMLLCILGEFERGAGFGKLALALADKYGNADTTARVCLVHGSFIHHWKEPVQAVDPLFDRGYGAALESGNFFYACTTGFGRTMDIFHRGDFLADVASVARKTYEFCENPAKDRDIAMSALSYVRMVACLQGKTHGPTDFSDDTFSEEAFVKEAKQSKHRSVHFLYHGTKAYLLYLFGAYDRALAEAELAEADSAAGAGLFNLADHYFIYALILAALLGLGPKYEKSSYRRKLRRFRGKLQKWAKACPANFQPRLLALDAEIARLAGQTDKAIALYDRACQAAREAYMLNLEALATELTGRFYLGVGQKKVSSLYLSEARNLYQRWGAVAKVASLEQDHGELMRSESSFAGSGISVQFTHTTTTESGGSSLDLATVMKAAQAISGEIIIERLLQRLMKILIENAGAETGYLIRERDGRLLIEAQGNAATGEAGLVPGQSLELESRVPVSIVQYVQRTRESVVLNDVQQEGLFNRDPYVVLHRPKSVLCTPILNQGQLTGILYLENNLATGAFTPERLAVLAALSSQASISIENARLYSDLEALANSYARFVPNQFLEHLGRESIVDVELGDAVQRELTILFTDIRSFTTMSEKLDAAGIFRFLNEYLARMSGVVHENRGFIDKFIGDAIMALFPESPSDALRAAVGMRRVLDAFNEERRAEGLPPIGMGIGINTGPVVLGTVGARNRMNTTVIGDAVNLASRLESVTKFYGSSIVLSQFSYHELRDLGDFRLREIDLVQVKGKTEPVQLFDEYSSDAPETMAKKDRIEPTLRRALDAYKSGDFARAKELFTECHRGCEEDSIPRLYLERCERLLTTPPAPGTWTGVYTMSTK